MNYGALSTTAKSLFEFDKIYANKNSMMADDGVLVGRFVLVNYSLNMSSISLNEEQYILYNLAIDNGYELPNGLTEDITMENILAEKNSNFVDYNNSIWVKTADGNYSMVFNSKLSSVIAEREATTRVRSNTTESYADYIGTIAEYFSFNGITSTEIDDIWEKNFLYKNNLLEDTLHLQYILYKAYISDNESDFSFTFESNEAGYTITNPINGNNIKEEGEFSEELIGKYIYLTSVTEQPIYQGVVTNVDINNKKIKFRTFLSLPESYTIKGYTIIKKDNAEIDIITADHIANLWYTGEFSGQED